MRTIFLNSLSMLKFLIRAVSIDACFACLRWCQTNQIAVRPMTTGFNVMITFEVALFVLSVMSRTCRQASTRIENSE